MTYRHLLLALAVIVVWGFNFVAIRWGVDEVPPLLLSALRYLGAAFPAVLFVPRPAVPLRLLLAYGLVIGAAQFGLLFVAMKLGMPAGLASLVMQLQAFFTIGLAVMLLRERPNAFQLGGAGLALAGIGLIGSVRGSGAELVPLLMTIAAAFFWGLGNILSKRAGRIDMLSFVVWSALVPPVPLLALSLGLEGWPAIAHVADELTWRGIAAMLFISYGATLFGYWGWNMLLSRYPTATVAPFSLLVPITGFGSAAVILGETISLLEIGGSLLVMVGLALNVFGPPAIGAMRPPPPPLS